MNLIPIADLVNIAHTLDAGELVLIRKAAAVEDQPDFTVLDEACVYIFSSCPFASGIPFFLFEFCTYGTKEYNDSGFSLILNGGYLSSSARTLCVCACLEPHC